MDGHHPHFCDTPLCAQNLGSVTKIAQSKSTIWGVGGPTGGRPIGRGVDLHEVRITLETTRLDDSTWTWPKIDIEGCDTWEDYELLTEAVAELGRVLVAIARRRSRDRRVRVAAARLHDGSGALRLAEDPRWYQLTLGL